MCFQEPGLSSESMQSAWPNEMDVQTAIPWSGLATLLTSGKTSTATFLRNINCGRVNKHRMSPHFQKRMKDFIDSCISKPSAVTKLIRRKANLD